MSAGSVQAGECDVVLPSIGPVDAVVDKVQSQAVGPRDLVLHNDAPVGAIHANPADVGAVTPVRPVQVPAESEQHQPSQWDRIQHIFGFRCDSDQHHIQLIACR